MGKPERIMFGLRSWRTSLAQWFLITSLWWPNWMGYLQIEWLIIWWLKKPNYSVLNDSLLLSRGPPRIECRAEREEPGFYSAPAYRRRDFFKNLAVSQCLGYSRVMCVPVLKTLVFSVSPLELAREWGKSHGTLFWLGRGPKIDSCSRQKIFIQS